MQVLVERTPLTLLALRIVVAVPLDGQHPGLLFEFVKVSRLKILLLSLPQPTNNV